MRSTLAVIAATLSLVAAGPTAAAPAVSAPTGWSWTR